MKECRILALLPFLAEGAVAIEILRSVPARGVDVTVAFCADTSALYPADGMEDFAANDRLIDLSRESIPGSLAVISEAIVERKIDLIFQVGATDLYHHLSRWKEGHPGLRVADLLYNEFAHTLNHFLYERCIDGVIVESESMREYVQRASFKSTPPVQVVLSGVDLSWFIPPPDVAARRSSSSTITLGYVGRMSPEKNPMGFVDIAERLLELDQELEFQMSGVGPETAAVTQRLAASGANRQVLYRGFVGHSEVRSALHELDALVLPSKFDGRPVIIMEANGCGIPVIAAPVGGVPELIEQGVNGFLVDPTDIESIHALLSSWKASPESLASVKKSAREYAVRYFDRERMLDDYAAAFRTIASG